MKVGLSQRQSQTLSPRLIESVEVLQMNSQELLEYIHATIQENPVLEIQESYSEQQEPTDLCRRLEWLESTDPQNREYHRQDSEADEDFRSKYGVVEAYQLSLHQHVQNQLKLLALPPETMNCAQFLARCLDRNGRLEEDLSELAKELNKPKKLMEQALDVIQSLSPPGIGARNLSECLCIQLRRQTPVDEVALRIAAEYLEAMSKNRYYLIARKLNVSQEKTIRACDLIRSLDPHPGSGFSQEEAAFYIIPDVIVIKESDNVEILPNNHFSPVLNVSKYYTQLLAESNDAEVKDYLEGKVRQAKWIIQAINQRQRTLMVCAQCIVEIQKEFFLRKGSLNPMTLTDVAQQVKLHESTVSRAINGKYLQCSAGTYPLSHFFSRRLSSVPGKNESSADAAKALLKLFVEQEDKRKPLSDQKLCERMVQHGCNLSRRTVAKYRDELGIPGTAGRKERF